MRSLFQCTLLHPILRSKDKDVTLSNHMNSAILDMASIVLNAFNESQKCPFDNRSIHMHLSLTSSIYRMTDISLTLAHTPLSK